MQRYMVRQVPWLKIQYLFRRERLNTNIGIAQRYRNNQLLEIVLIRERSDLAELVGKLQLTARQYLL